MVGVKKKRKIFALERQWQDLGKALLECVVLVIQRFFLPFLSLKDLFDKKKKKQIRKKGLTPPKEMQVLPKQVQQAGIARRGPRKEIKDMTKRRRNQILEEVWKGAKEIAGKNSKEAILLLAKRLEGKEEEENWKEKFQQLSKNVRELFESRIRENKGKAATIISCGFSLREGSEMTGVSKPMISIGRRVLVSQLRVKRGRHPAEIPSKEKQDFRAFALDRAPVKSGSKKDRRVQENSFKEFYIWEYLPWSQKKGYPPRSITKVKGWLKELGIKPNKFDRYRCLVCFEGREAQKRERQGRPEEGDEEKIKKMEEHEALYKHQLEAAKKDKGVNNPKKMLVIYDYTTIHDLTTVKVSFLSFYPFILLSFYPFILLSFYPFIL